MQRLPPAGRAAIGLAIVVLLVAGCRPEAVATNPTPTPGATATASGNRPFRPTPAPLPTFASYTVRRGDTLDGIALRFSTSRESLAYWNRATYPSLDPESPSYDPNRVEAGWTLVYLPGTVVDPENLPGSSASPGAATIEPYPSPDPDGAAVLVAHGPRGTRAVALTFELAGSRAAGAEAAVQWLAAGEIPAAIFVEGRMAAGKDPEVAAALARLAEAPALVLGTTGWDGADPAALDPDGAAAALARADEALAASTGHSALPWYRSPTGTASELLLEAVGRDGWTWAVSWEVDPGDDLDPDRGGPTAEDITTRVRAAVTGGSIVRLRLAGPRTLEALPLLVDGLREDGWQLVGLPELLGLEAGA